VRRSGIRFRVPGSGGQQQGIKECAKESVMATPIKSHQDLEVRQKGINLVVLM